MSQPSAHAISSDVWAIMRPRAKVRTWDWARDNVCDNQGMPFDAENFPWVEGVCDAFDDPHVRVIVMQWASRISKTFATQTCALS